MSNSTSVLAGITKMHPHRGTLAFAEVDLINLGIVIRDIALYYDVEEEYYSVEFPRMNGSSMPLILVEDVNLLAFITKAVSTCYEAKIVEEVRTKHL